MSEEFSSAHLHRASMLLNQGRFAEAEKHLRDALAQDPNDAPTLFTLAVCQFRQAKNNEALTTVDRAIAGFPFEGGYFSLRSHILTGLHRYKEALVASAEAISLAPDSPSGFNARASALGSQNRWQECEVSARQALALDPNDETAASILATALRMQNRLSESAEQVGFMLSSNPESSDNHINAGWVALQRNDHRQAQEHFREALRIEPNNSHARDGLKEAFKARSWIYRAYLNYCFFMQRFTAEKQWLLLIGLVVFVNIGSKMFTGPLWFVGLLIAVVYFLFVLWVHVARSVGNFMLLWDRFARHALSRAESIEAVAVGGGVLLGLLLFVVGLVAGLPPALTLGLTMIGASFPLAYVFTNESKLGRIVFGAAAAFVLCVGVAIAVQSIAGKIPKNLEGARQAAVFVVIAVTWLANVPSLRR